MENKRQPPRLTLKQLLGLERVKVYTVYNAQSVQAAGSSWIHISL